MYSPRLFFLHNPKAGGSSLRSSFSALGGEICTSPELDCAPNHYRRRQSDLTGLRGADLYFGHCGYQSYLDLRDGHLAVTNFRDPAQRVHSLYRYWKFNVGLEDIANLHPGDVAVVRLAHDLSFSDFIRADNADLQLYIGNFHFRQLYRSGWERQQPSMAATSTVKRRIRKMPWFYIAETPEASAYLLRRLFPRLDRVPVENRSRSGGEPLANKDVDYLVSLNLLDYEIYAYACTLQATRLAAAATGVRPGHARCAERFEVTPAAI